MGVPLPVPLLLAAPLLKRWGGRTGVGAGGPSLLRRVWLANFEAVAGDLAMLACPGSTRARASSCWPPADPLNQAVGTCPLYRSAGALAGGGPAPVLQVRGMYHWDQNTKFGGGFLKPLPGPSNSLQCVDVSSHSCPVHPSTQHINAPSMHDCAGIAWCPDLLHQLAHLLWVVGAPAAGRPSAARQMLAAAEQRRCTKPRCLQNRPGGQAHASK